MTIAISRIVVTISVKLALFMHLQGVPAMGYYGVVEIGTSVKSDLSTSKNT